MSSSSFPNTSFCIKCKAHTGVVEGSSEQVTKNNRLFTVSKCSQCTSKKNMWSPRLDANGIRIVPVKKPKVVHSEETHEEQEAQAKKEPKTPRSRSSKKKPVEESVDDVTPEGLH